MHFAVAPFRTRAWQYALASLLAVAGCTSGNSPTDGSIDGPTDASRDGAIDTPTEADAPPASNDCDPIGGGTLCTFPWPSNLYLVPDSTRATGYTLTFGATSLPQNTSGPYVDPSPFTRMDGYGVGTPIMVQFPNLDVSHLPSEADPSGSVDPNAAIQLFEVSGTTLTRVPYFVELDSHEMDPALQILFVRPAVILKEATHYIVAMRNLVDTHGAAIQPSAAFAALRDGTTAGMPFLAARQARFDAMFALLQSGANLARSSLTLAWDFNTASGAALHGRLLHMRDDAVGMAGGHGATLTSMTVTQYIPTDDHSGRPVEPNIAFEIHGTFAAPNYLKPRMVRSTNGVQLNLDATGQPTVNTATPMRTPEFWIRIPYSAVRSVTNPLPIAHGIVQYGHGLLGSGGEVESGYLGVFANTYHYILFSADLTGMAAGDYAYVLAALSDVSNFVSIADGLHQGMTEWVVLARAMKDHGQAFIDSLPETMNQGITLDPTRMFYSGNSQGGIFGGTYVAISPDITRGHLGVPGNNYATLLHRSTDFQSFFMILRDYYTTVEDQAVVIALLQLLWDPTDSVSYLRHIESDPFTAGSPHHVILTPAKGDHQVSPLTNEILARTGIGIPLMNHYDTMRTPWGATQQAYPFTGSGVVLYAFGNNWPSPGNHVTDDTNPDPHERPRRQALEQQQVSHFFETGVIEDVCNAMSCVYNNCVSDICQPTF